MLSDTPINSVPTTRRIHSCSRERWSKEACCGAIWEGVQAWLKISKEMGDQNNRAVCSVLTVDYDIPHSNLTDLANLVVHCQENVSAVYDIRDIKKALLKVAEANLMELRQKGRKRKKDILLFPASFVLESKKIVSSLSVQEWSMNGIVCNLKK